MQAPRGKNALAIKRPTESSRANIGRGQKIQDAPIIAKQKIRLPVISYLTKIPEEEEVVGHTVAVDRLDSKVDFGRHHQKEGDVVTERSATALYCSDQVNIAN